MLNARAIKHFLTDNVDEHAPHAVFMTDHGTILGHDVSANITTIRKFSAFAATTWRTHEIAVAQSGILSPKVDLPWGKTHQVVLKGNKIGVLSLTCEVEGFVSVVRPVKERTLVAVLLEKEKLVGDTDPLSLKILGRDAVDDSAARTVDGLQIGDAGKDTISEESGECNAASFAETESKKKKSEYDDSTDSDLSAIELKLSKLRILELRAEGLADVMTEDLKDFEVPDTFY